MTEIKSPSESQLVLVTDGSGYVGVHCILQLLKTTPRVEIPTQPDLRLRPTEETIVPCDQSKVKLGLLGDL